MSFIWQSPCNRPCEDFRFPLMRQWSVREALVHSRYVAVRLQTWQDKGRRQVDELLSNMGLALKHCKQDFCAYPCPFCSAWMSMVTIRWRDIQHRF